MRFMFNTKEILEKLRVNREEHIKIVREAQKGLRDRWRKMLTGALEDLDEGDPVEPSLHLTIPSNHTDDFDRAIQMFEMITDEEVSLREESFQAYVRNEWHWRQQFLMSNMAYSESANVLYQDDDQRRVSGEEWVEARKEYLSEEKADVPVQS